MRKTYWAITIQTESAAPRRHHEGTDHAKRKRPWNPPGGFAGLPATARRDQCKNSGTAPQIGRTRYANVGWSLSPAPTEETPNQRGRPGAYCRGTAQAV